MKQLIKDKKIQKCICSKDNTSTVRTAKQRVTSWMVITVILVVCFLLISGGYYNDLEELDFMDALAPGVAVFTLTYTAISTVKYKRLRHSFRCSIRRGFIEAIGGRMN